MSRQEEKFTDYLNEQGILPRLVEILEQVLESDPLPADPLMTILHALGCPLIPQAQMKALERKVSRAQDELRYLRRVLIELGGEENLYDSDTDENEYVGHIGEIGAALLYPQNATSYEERKTPRQSEQTPQYIVEASIAIEQQAQTPLSLPATNEDEQVCSSQVS